MITLLDGVKMAYRKHHLDDPSIGWDELSDVLHLALCNEMGDRAFLEWLEEIGFFPSVGRPTQRAPDLAESDAPDDPNWPDRDLLDTFDEPA